MKNRCRRCQGLLVAADFIDKETDWAGWKCEACGDWTALVILAHRQLGPPPEPQREHTLPVYRPQLLNP